MAASTLPPAADAPAPCARTSRAVDVAEANLRANLRAFTERQPRLAQMLEGATHRPRFVYARDGSLTALDADGKWWRGCSVPMAAAEAMLSSLEARGRVVCLLAPTHAAHVRVSLRRSRPDQAVVALCPDGDDLHVMVACDDFSPAIRSNRLWFAWGDDWADELRRLFAERPCLATAAQFIRLPVTPGEQVERLVSASQAVFAETNAARVGFLARRRSEWKPPVEPRARLCVVAPSHFHLWNDAGAILAESLTAETRGPAAGTTAAAQVIPFDPDDPACSSALALLEKAECCSAVVAADTFRADLPGVAPDAMPWVTWITRAAHVRPFGTAGSFDAVILADPEWRQDALTSGWPDERIVVGGWPTAVPPGAPPVCPPKALAVVADTRPIVMPAALEEFSSHQLLWNDVLAELTADPFALRGDPVAYLHRRMERHGVAPDGFDATAVMDALVLPAYAQGIVRALIACGLPVRLFGAGWEQIEAFRPAALGAVVSRAELAGAHHHACAVVDVAAVAGAHPLHRIGLPVLRPSGRNRGQFLDAAARALANPPAPPPPTAPVTLRQILAMIEHSRKK